jgi:hypothetical protein
MTMNIFDYIYEKTGFVLSPSVGAPGVGGQAPNIRENAAIYIGLERVN